MNVIQRPRPREFCGSMQDYVIDTDVTISFAVRYGNRTILDEEYVPDGNNQVRVRRLGQFCELALWGVWCAGENTPQSDAAGVFTFLINGVEDASSLVMFSRLRTKKDAMAPGCLSEVSVKVTRPESKEYVSGYPLRNTAGDKFGFKLIAYREDDSSEESFIAVAGTEDDAATAFTVDVSPETVVSAFPDVDIARYQVAVNGGSMMFYIDRTLVAEQWCFRFKNVYDMPETLTASGGMKMAGSNESETSVMYGVERKFGLKVTDEYTVNSGTVMLQSDYKLWHNLLNAQEAEIFVDGEWLPVVITKQKFEREFRRSLLKTVEFSFRMADPENNNLVGL